MKRLRQMPSKSKSNTERSYNMKKKVKIVTIGGGSSYTPELVEGFIKRYDELPISELWLVDIEEGREKLEIVGSLAQRMVKKAGLPMKVILTLDRRSALKDADFVTTQMRIGRLPARVLDERIPISHGVIGQETNGAGGMFKALRTIPVLMDIVNDIKELCPNAWLINFTNPVGAVMEALFSYTDFKKIIGLCNVPITMNTAIAKLFDVEPSRLRLEISGLNHHFFVTDCFIDGQSKMSELLDIYENLKEEDYVGMANIMAFPWSKSLIRGLKVVPCPYLSYYFFTKDQLEHQQEVFKDNNVRAEFVKRVEAELFELYKDANLAEKPKQLEQRGGAQYSDAACSLINSIYNNKCDVQYVNTLNKGAISNLPDDSVAEMACMITKDGPVPLAIGELPTGINGTIQNIKTFEKMVAQAAVTGNRDMAIAALTVNPLVTSDKLSNLLFDELFEAHRRYLPQFKDKEHTL